MRYMEDLARRAAEKRAAPDGRAARPLLRSEARGNPKIFRIQIDPSPEGLRCRLSGRLDAVNFEEGDTVSAGDVIAVLDTAPLRDGVAQAEAEASVRRAAVRTAT